MASVYRAPPCTGAGGACGADGAGVGGKGGDRASVSSPGKAARERYRALWFGWGAGDARSGMREAKVSIYERTEVPHGATCFWSMAPFLGAIPAARTNPSRWLARAGAAKNPSQFLAASGAAAEDLRPSVLAVHRRKGAGIDRVPWLQGDFICGTRFLLAALLRWSVALNGKSALAAKSILLDWVGKVCGEECSQDVKEHFGAAFPANVEFSSVVSAIDASNVVLSLEVTGWPGVGDADALRRDLVGSLARFIEECARRRGGARREDAVTSGVAQRGIGGKRRRIDSDILEAVHNLVGAREAKIIGDFARNNRLCSMRAAKRKAETKTIAYFEATRDCLGAERQASISFDETDVGGEGTMNVCLYAHHRQKAAWLAPQVRASACQIIVNCHKLQ